MERVELDRLVFEAAGECARTGNTVRVAAEAGATAADYESAFADWQSLGGRAVQMRLLEEADAVGAEFTRVEESREWTLTDALARRLPRRGRRV